MSWKDNYQKWANYSDLDLDLKKEMELMDDSKKEECFSHDLEFGTGGMRGILGAGTNRMNIYMVRKASLGFARYLNTKEGEKSIVIAHDNRYQSVEFAKETAKVFASMGFKAYLYKEMRPTPTLSFAVRYLKTTGGVMITASHNPKNYNGYKIYDADGCQLIPYEADQVIAEINKITDLFSIETNKNSELITYLDSDIDDAYLEALKTIVINKYLKKDFKVVYTPLHGTGSVFAPKLLQWAGYDAVLVDEQMVPDPAFSATKNPNPEDARAFELAIEYGKKNNAKLLLATDPDADRVAIAVLHNGEYQLLTGNQTGALLVNYILEQRSKLGTLPKEGWLFSTIVSSPLALKIADSYGLKTKSVLTGFKFIGEQAKILETSEGEYVFGSEESCGYLIKDFVRDKDSFQALLMLCEICAYYHEQNKTMVDGLNEIYEKYGFYKEGLKNIVLEGLEGSKKINEIMEYFRNNVVGFNFSNIVAKEDYKLSQRSVNGLISELTLPKSNVIKYFFEDGSWFVLRPSGTEPKLKVYYGVKGENHTDANKKLEELSTEVLALVNRI